MFIEKPDILTKNIIFLCSLLREAGVPIGIDRSIDAVRAIDLTSLYSYDDFYWSLATVLINKKDHMKIFERVFQLFWSEVNANLDFGKSGKKENDFLEKEEPTNDNSYPSLSTTPDSKQSQQRQAINTSNTPLLASTTASINQKDFNRMSPEEITIARKLVSSISLPIRPIRTRRWEPNRLGKGIDLRSTIKKSLRTNGQPLHWYRISRKTIQPSIILLCDISGSMKNYSKILLHFLHSITHKQEQVSTFLFGTQLTNVTRELRQRDINTALDHVSNLRIDWGAGTRIGSAIKQFNFEWSRRVLTQNGVVILISDGLDSDAGKNLKKPMERLRKSCKKIIWLNPLLRYTKFRPISSGASIIRPYADLFLPVHNLDSLKHLSEVFAANKIN